MRAVRVRELLVLFVGDVVFLFLSLWFTLALRYLALPNPALWSLHLVPFSLLFIVWLLVFFIVGLYDQHTRIFRARLPEKILRVQVGNIVIAALFFFFVPIFGIAPKTNLLLYLVISFALIVWWRGHLFPFISRTSMRQDALLVGGGLEFKELLDEVNGNPRYHFYFKETISVDHLQDGALSGRLFTALKNPTLSFLVIDTRHRKLVNILPHLHKPIFSNVQFIDARDLYEEIFERMPLSVLEDGASLERFTIPGNTFSYTLLKRLIDIIGGIVMGVLTLLLTPIVWIAMRLEGPGPLFISQERFGQNGTRGKSYKFRSMSFNDHASASWVGEGVNKVTKVGAILRKTSLDEFPQFINILKGQLSLVGPRNDIWGLGERLSEEISLYHLRYSVKPGITGWAQINQQYEQGNISPQSIAETKVRLAYDFYYIKNRSLMLDIMIMLKTLKRMVFRVSS